MPEDDSAGLLQTNNLLLEQEDLGPPPADTLDFDWRAPSPQRKDSPPPASPCLPSEQDPRQTPGLPSESEDDPLEAGIDDDQQRSDEVALGQDVQPDDLPGGPNNWLLDNLVPHLDALHTSTQFIDQIHLTMLENNPIPPESRERLQFPIVEAPDINADLRMCIDIFVQTINGSQATYDGICQAIKRRSPKIKTLTYDQMWRKLSDLTGVFPVMTDMCNSSCVAFTGPFSKLQSCPVCPSERYETVMQGNRLVSVPCKQALTIPVGPQIQAQYWSQEGAWNMGHRSRVMEPMLVRLHAGGSIKSYDNVYSGSILIDAAMRGDLTPSDTILMLSIDGAQLYKSKQLDCWIYIWVLLNLAPELQYKKKYVLPGGFIPGPNKLKNLDSFVFTGLHHLSALQKDGLRIWDCRNGHVFTS